MVKIKPNTIVHFKGDYTDDNGKPAKERRHIVLEIKGDEVFFLKLTSAKKEKDLYAKWIGQTDCLNKISYVILNRKIKIFLTDLETTNYQYFYICSLHPNGCLDKDLFAEISQKVGGLWEDELTRDKKIISVEANKLKSTREIPWWINYTGKERNKKKAEKLILVKLLNNPNFLFYVRNSYYHYPIN